MSSYLQSVEHARSASLVDLRESVLNKEYDAGGSLAVYDPATRTMYNLRPGKDGSGQWRPTVYAMKRSLSTPSQQFVVDNKWNVQNTWNCGMSWVAIIGRKLIAVARGSSTSIYYRVFDIAPNGELSALGETKELTGVLPTTTRSSPQKSKVIVRGSSIIHLLGVHNASVYNAAVYKFDFNPRENEIKVSKAKWLTNVNANANYGLIQGSIGTEYYSAGQHTYAMDFTFDMDEGYFIAVHAKHGNSAYLQFVTFNEDLEVVRTNYVSTGYNTGYVSYYRFAINCPPGTNRMFIQRESAAANNEFVLLSLKKSDYSDLRYHHVADTHIPGNTSSNWYEAYGRSLAYIGNKLYMVWKDASWRNAMLGFDFTKYPSFSSADATHRTDMTYLQRDYNSGTGTSQKGYGTSDNESYIEQMENNSDYFGSYTIGIGMAVGEPNKLFWYAWKNDFIGSDYPIGYKTAYVDLDTADMDALHQMELVTVESQLEKVEQVYFDLGVEVTVDTVVTEGGVTLIGGQVNELYRGE